MQIYAKILVIKCLLAQIVALNQIYKMQFRAKLYLKLQSFSTSIKFQPLMQIHAKIIKLKYNF